MLCTSKICPFSLGNYSGTPLIIGNLMIIRVTSVEWRWLGLEWSATPKIFGHLFQEFLSSYLFGVISYYFIPSILLKLIVYIFKLTFTYASVFPLIIQQLYVICHINEKTTPR